MDALEPSSLYMCGRVAASGGPSSGPALKDSLDSGEAGLIIVPPGGGRDRWGVPANTLERASQKMRKQATTLARGFRWGDGHGR